jgi:hypothetical protein
LKPPRLKKRRRVREIRNEKTNTFIFNFDPWKPATRTPFFNNQNHLTMKKILFAAASLLFILVACNEATTSDDDAGAAKNTERNNEIYRAIETGDVSKLDSFVAADIIDHEGDMNGNPVRGRDSVKAMLADIHNHFDNLKIETISESTSADGKYHFAMIRFMGTTKDNSMGAPAGTVINSVAMDVVRIENGLAVEHWGFRQPAEMMKMMQGMQGGAKPNPSDTLNK